MFSAFLLAVGMLCIYGQLNVQLAKWTIHNYNRCC